MLSFLSELNHLYLAKYGNKDPSVRESIGVEQTSDSIVLSNPRWSRCDSDIWTNLTDEFLLSVMDGRNGCLLTIDMLNFSLEKLDCDVALEFKGSNNLITQVYYKDCWTNHDIQYITHSPSIHCSTVLMIPDCDPLKALRMSPVDIYNMLSLYTSFKNLHKCPRDMEILGCYCDGEYAAWFNYPNERAKLVVNKLQLLASHLGVSVDMLVASAGHLEGGEDILRGICNPLVKTEDFMRREEPSEMKKNNIKKENHVFPNMSTDSWIMTKDRVETTHKEEEIENSPSNFDLMIDIP